MQMNMGPFPTQKGRTFHNMHASSSKKVLFVAVLPSRPEWLAHKQFGVPEVTYYVYSNMRVLRVLVQNLLCSSDGSCLSKLSQTLVSDFPLTSFSTSLLALPIQELQGIYQPYSHCCACPAPTVSLQGTDWKVTEKLNQEQFAGRLSAQVQTCLFVNGTFYKRHFLSSLVAVSPWCLLKGFFHWKCIRLIRWNG